MTNKLQSYWHGGLAAVTLLLLSLGCAAQGTKMANKKIIKAYYAAYEKKDWNMMTGLLAPGFTFTSPNDNHIDLKTYKKRCWPNAYNIKKFDLEKIMTDGDEAFVTYNGWTKDGRVFRNTEYFKIEAGKIKENDCFFGPGVSYPNNTKK